MKALRIASLALCPWLAACGGIGRFTITSEPSGAFVQVDGQNAGTTPFALPLDFRSKQAVVVAASKPGYFNESVTLTPESDALSRGELRLVLMEDEAWKVTTTSEATNAWLRIPVEAKLQADAVWQKLVDSVTSAYSSLEQLDTASGYLRSVATVRKFKGPKGEYRVRTRFVGAIASKEPVVYKLKIEADISDWQGDWVPYSRVFKQDAALIEELQNRLGVK